MEWLPFPLATPIEERLRSLIARALDDPSGDLSELRALARSLAFDSLEAGHPVQTVVATVTASLRAAASPDTPYFDFDQVRERLTLWVYTIYHRTPARGIGPDHA